MLICSASRRCITHTVHSCNLSLLFSFQRAFRLCRFASFPLLRGSGRYIRRPSGFVKEKVLFFYYFNGEIVFSLYIPHLKKQKPLLSLQKWCQEPNFTVLTAVFLIFNFFRAFSKSSSASPNFSSACPLNVS